MALRFVLLLVAAAIVGGLIGYGMHARERDVAVVSTTPAPAPIVTASPPAAAAQPVAAQTSNVATPAASVAPHAAATPASVLTAAPAAAPPATPAAAPSVAAAAKDEPPQILDVSLPAVVHGNTTVSGMVTTTPNVTAVTATVQGFAVDVPRAGPGKFGISYPIPSLPIFIKGNWTVQLTAKTAAGASTSRSVTVNLQ